MFHIQNYQFTDLEIMTLWNSFRIDFPEGQLSAPQLQDVVRRVFPKYCSVPASDSPLVTTPCSDVMPTLL